MPRKPSGAKRSAHLLDITPERFLCSVSMACPAVFEAADGGSFVIIGEVCDTEANGLEGRIGKDEKAIKISADLLLTALRPYLSK